jgi:hypothetical protein
MKNAQTMPKSQPSKVADFSQFSILHSQFLDRGALLLIAIFLLLLPLSTPRIYATDEVQYFAYLRSLYFDGDLDFHNEYQHFAEIGLKNGDPAVFNALLRDNPQDPPRIAATGMYRNVAPIGSALLWSPGFALADLLVRATNLLGAGIPADGYSWPYIAAICFMSALYSLLGLLLTYRLARRYSSVFAATLATTAVWLATPLVFYTYILMPWSHTAGFFLFALFLTLWLRDAERDDAGRHDAGRPGGSPLQVLVARRSIGVWVLLGLVGGLMTITREQLGLLLIMPAVEGLVAYAAIARTKNKEQRTKNKGAGTENRRTAEPQNRKPRTENPEPGNVTRSPLHPFIGHAVFLLTFAVALIPQLLVYQALYGRPQPSATVAGKLEWSSPHFFDTLIDPAHGAFLWSPILAIGVLGLFLLWRRDRLLAALLLLGFLAQTYINGAISTWHLSGSFGFRRLIDSTPIFVLGLAALLEWLRTHVGRWPLLAAALLLIGWNAGLIANWTVLHKELRPGLVWPDLWRWQIEAPAKALAKAGDLLFRRCGLVKNGC